MQEAVPMHSFTLRQVRSLKGETVAPAWKNKWGYILQKYRVSQLFSGTFLGRL
jgi:hypothetical protein